MEFETRKKLRIVLISFLIILIPLFFLFKWFYAVDIHNNVMNDIIVKFHQDSSSVESGIKQLEKAKKLARKNYLIYYDQARLYAINKKYDKAIETLNEYLKIKPKQKVLYLKALIFDTSGQIDSAKVLYKKIFDSHKPFRNANDSIYYISNFTFLIYGQDSALNSLKVLMKKYPNIEEIPIIINDFSNTKREEFVYREMN